MTTNTQPEEISGEINVTDTSMIPTESNDTIIEESHHAVNTFARNDDMSWDDLVLAKNEAVGSLLNQQLLLRELILQSESIILSDPELHEMVKGLAKSYDDVSADIRVTMDKHFSGTEPTRTGKVSDEDYLEYLQIAGEYITYAETVATLSGTGYLDIFTRIKAAVINGNEMNDSLASLQETVSEGTQAIANLQEEK